MFAQRSGSISLFTSILKLQISRINNIGTMDIIRQSQHLAWCKPDWCFPSMSKEANELLRQCLPTTSNITASVEEVIERSRKFPVPFPIESPRLHTLREKIPSEDLQRNIDSTYPLIHERVLLLITHFLIYKREFGSTIEKALYKDMTLIAFIDRLLKKRAVVFMNAQDYYTLLSGEEGQDGWEQIGTPHQKPPLLLDTCLSYDEMKISSMLYVSGRTRFINDGSRRNSGVEGPSESSGVILGLIGPRFEREQKMEYEDVLITEHQNSLVNGYGEEVTPTTCLNVLKTTYVRNNQSAKHMWRQMWSEFYQVHSYTYDEHQSYYNVVNPIDDKQKYTDRYVRLKSGEIFDNEVYYKRLSIPFECALLDANDRGLREEKMVFLNIVGIGLGVWKVSEHQTDVFLLTFVERLRYLLKRNALHRISDVNFAFIRPSDGIKALFTSSKSNTNNQTTEEHKMFLESKRHPNSGINVQLENREPSAQLTGDHYDKLLVTTYPWDGNAHPGNEFWLGSLTGSGDPAAACSSQIAELHNAHINPTVTGSNVRIVTGQGVVSLQDYVRSLDL